MLGVTNSSSASEHVGITCKIPSSPPYSVQRTNLVYSEFQVACQGIIIQKPVVVEQSIEHSLWHLCILAFSLTSNLKFTIEVPP
jgi:hypothetical protein